MLTLGIINGPNLNLTGIREPEMYGIQTFDELLSLLRKEFPAVEFLYFQSNVEGELVNCIQEWGFSCDGIILNAGAYTHTSVALADAVAAITSPVMEVHLSNVSAREPFRHYSFISPHACGIITGLGMDSYRLAVHHFTGRKV